MLARVQHAGPTDSQLRELGHTPLGDVGLCVKTNFSALYRLCMLMLEGAEI